MCRYVVAVAILMVELVMTAPPPLRVTIDCGSDEDPAQMSNSRSAELLRSNSRFDINSFCELIQHSIPRVVEGRKFIIEAEDQEVYSDSVAPVTVSPPSSFIHKFGFPKLKPPRLRTPELNVPRLKPKLHQAIPPRIGSPMPFPEIKFEDERLEKFKKSVQKMLHFITVLGKIDHYISERTRIIVNKLSKTFSH